MLFQPWCQDVVGVRRLPPSHFSVGEECIINVSHTCAVFSAKRPTSPLLLGTHTSISATPVMALTRFSLSDSSYLPLLPASYQSVP